MLLAIYGKDFRLTTLEYAEPLRSFASVHFHSLLAWFTLFFSLCAIECSRWSVFPLALWSWAQFPEDRLLLPATARALSAVALLPFCTLLGAAQDSSKLLTVDAIYAHGSLIGSPPDEIAWSPDGKHVTYLDGGELIDLDPGTGRPHVLIDSSKLEHLIRNDGPEKDRDHRTRYNMPSYLWAPDSEHLIFDADGWLWVYDLHSNTGVQLCYTGAASGDDPKFSPDGKSVSFIRNNGISVIHLRDLGTPTIEAVPAPNVDTLNGKVDWVYEEELDTRSNYFWSPDSSRIAFLQTSESDVSTYPIVDWIPTHAQTDFEHYPVAGDPNPNVRVGVASANGGRITWIKLPIQEGQDYTPRFGWADRHTLWIETVTRDQKHRGIYLADADSGQSRRILDIADEKFVDENYNIWAQDGQIVLSNWSDGHNHLYLYSFDTNQPGGPTAKLVKQLTSGDFEVGEVYKVDFKNKRVDYASNEGNPVGQQIWQVGFDGARKQLSVGDGSHTGDFSPVNDAFVDHQSARLDPPTLSLCQTAGKCKVIWQTRALDSYHLRAPEQLQIKARDGTTLYATLLLPEDATDRASVPLIVNPYGGPGSQQVTDRWNDAVLFDELLAQHGFAVLHADNRGSSGRGRAFAQAAYRNFGPVQLEDQLTVVDAALAEYPQLDGKRLGFWGWSWGGTFTLYAMTHSNRFKAGVAVAPVTDWENYDTVYTERYLGKPEDFPAGYKEFSVVNSAAALKGRVLLVHGAGDDNVHFSNTVQFVQALVEAGIPYDLDIYPRKTHSLSGAKVRTHLYDRILAQFEEQLKPPAQ